MEKKENNDCTYFTTMGTCCSLKLCTFESLMSIPSCVVLNPRNIVLLHKKLHFLKLQYIIYWYKYCSTCSSNVKCSFTIHEYKRVLSRNTNTPEYNILENRLFMFCMNVAGLFISPMGITTHLYRLYHVGNAVFEIFLTAIWHCQYPLQKSKDVKYFLPPI